MDLIKKILILAVLMLSMTWIYSQDTESLQTAFEESYTFETDGNYADAIKILKTTYDPSSYHLNARLGWLSYLSGQFTESAAYYQKAIELKPYALEARFGLRHFNLSDDNAKMAATDEKIIQSLKQRWKLLYRE